MPYSPSSHRRYFWPAVILSCLSLMVAIAVSLLLYGNRQTADTSTDLLKSLSQGSERLATKVLPALVRVFVTKREVARRTDELALLFGDNLTLPHEDLGSGMFIDSHGTVLTNYHVVRDAIAIEVVTYDGQRTQGQIVGSDSLTDLAILKTTLQNTTTIDWEQTEQPSVGDFVWAFGSPFGLENSVSLGIVSSKRNPASSDSPFQDFVQTDVAINPGSSGGPLVNVSAKVIGINTAIAGDRFQGVSFAIPSDIASQVAAELMKNGRIERGWLGVELVSVDGERARRAGLDGVNGVYIQSTVNTAGSGSEGLLAGDICLDIEGKPINDPVLFSRTIAAFAIGRKIHLTVQREGKRIPIVIQVAARPQ